MEIKWPGLWLYFTPRKSKGINPNDERFANAFRPVHLIPGISAAPPRPETTVKELFESEIVHS